MPQWAFVSPLHYLMTPLCTFWEESNYHRIPAPLYLCGLEMGPSENLAALSSLNAVFVSGGRISYVICDQVTAHFLWSYIISLWPTSRASSISVLGAQISLLFPLADTACLRCVHHCLFPRSFSSATAPQHCNLQDRGVFPWGQPSTL